MMSELHDKKLSSFELLERMHSDEFSTLYTAKCKLDGKYVGLKKVQLSEMIDSEARQNCIKEINLIQQLNHPNVIKYLASFIDDNELYIVLDLADCTNLSRMIKYFKENLKLFPEEIILKYTAQVCEALEHMHSKEVMNIDIQPASVFITAEGVVKIGIVRLGRFFNSKITAAHSSVDAQYVIHKHVYNFKADLFCLGCMIFEMAALQSPFYGENSSLDLLNQKIKEMEAPVIPSNVYKKVKFLFRVCFISTSFSRIDMTFVRKCAVKYLKPVL